MWITRRSDPRPRARDSIDHGPGNTMMHATPCAACSSRCGLRHRGLSPKDLSLLWRIVDEQAPVEHGPHPARVHLARELGRLRIGGELRLRGGERPKVFVLGRDEDLV